MALRFASVLSKQRSSSSGYGGCSVRHPAIAQQGRPTRSYVGVTNCSVHIIKIIINFSNSNRYDYLSFMICASRGSVPSFSSLSIFYGSGGRNSFLFRIWYKGGTNKCYSYNTYTTNVHMCGSILLFNLGLINIYPSIMRRKLEIKLQLIRQIRTEQQIS